LVAVVLAGGVLAGCTTQIEPSTSTETAQAIHIAPRGEWVCPTNPHIVVGFSCTVGGGRAQAEQVCDAECGQPCIEGVCE
jgi:hypothetical protein